MPTTKKPTATDPEPPYPKPGLVALPDRPAPPGPLQLASEPRTESYELVAPGGTVVEVTHNIDTGQRSYHWTSRTTLAGRQVPDPGDSAA